MLPYIVLHKIPHIQGNLRLHTTEAQYGGKELAVNQGFILAILQQADQLRMLLAIRIREPDEG